MRSSLTDAAFNGKIQDLEQLLDAGEDIDANDGIWNPLHAAIENEHSNCVELLLRHGANVERVCAELTPLAHAVDIAIDGAIQSGCKLDDEPVGIIASFWRRVQILCRVWKWHVSTKTKRLSNY